MPEWNGAKWIRREKRLAIYARDGFECVYCQTHENLSLDHLHPRSKGRDNRSRNLVTACRMCNMQRGDRVWWSFAGDDAAKRIRRNRRRGLAMRKKWAKHIISQASDWNDAIACGIAQRESG